ncbi:PUS7 [Candida theae]|uniref:PUS7 n=1 Tax=Candida theae TaxID=1198502 RepID=A0AAD5FWB5_9ASCO|nr:PUS7 [Candida theae]KAI5948716.1 PUS7 [Candida theae]
MNPPYQTVPFSQSEVAVLYAVKRAVSHEDLPGAKKLKPTLIPALTEEAVGILKFINPNSVGFQGSLKTLHSDFQVNEIEPSGHVVYLTDLGIDMGKSRKEKKLEQKAKEAQEFAGKTDEEIASIKAERAKAQENEPKYELSEEDRNELLAYISEEELKQIEQLFHTGNHMETKTTIDDKEKRGKLHQLLRKAFQGKLESTTSSENTFKIVIAKNRGNNRRGGDTNIMDSMHHVDENGVINYGLGPFKPYLHFAVFKQNRDTMDVANNIAKMLRISPKTINYAGTKDRRGVTCQKFCISRGKVLRVSALNKMKNSNFKLGRFTYEDYPLKLGDLAGNEFTITLRDVKPAVDEGADADLRTIVAQCFDSLDKHGFINYFGMQRFGSFSVPTHELGIALLQEDWEKCVELLLSEQEVCSPGTMEMRKIWKEKRDAKEASKALPRHFVAENCILKVLSSEQQDSDKKYKRHSYLKSLLAIPKNLRMMYVHAYQSYVWNLVASKRIELFGLEVQEGDLVFDEQGSNKATSVDYDGFEEDVAVSNTVAVRALTKEDIDSGKYSIFDVVLPSPGFKIEYPTNEKLRQVYIDTMAKDNLDPFNLMRKNKEFSLTGAYRTLLSKPKDLSYEIIEYRADGKPLVKTDLEILEMKNNGDDIEAVESTLSERIIKHHNNDADDGAADPSAEAKFAVVLKMKLDVSSYATMALREFMRIDTSRYAQMK